MAIGFTAFTPSVKSTTVKHATTTLLYWYEVDGVDFGRLIEDQMYKRSEVKENGQHRLTDCNGDVAGPCIVGADKNNQAGNALPVLTSENTIFEE